MTQDMIVSLGEVVAGAAIVITFMITASKNIRAQLRPPSDQAADAALKAAQRAHEQATQQLAEARQLAARFREHRQWIEEHPDQFRAALLAQLTAGGSA